MGSNKLIAGASLAVLAIAACGADPGLAGDLGSLVKVSGSANVQIDFAVKGSQGTVESWRKLTDATGGMLYQSHGDADMASLTAQAMTDALTPGAPVDIVFCVDTTGSMQDDIDAVKAKLSDIVDGLSAKNPDWQAGVATYRDRDSGEEYVSKTVTKLTHDKPTVLAGIAALVAKDGGDWREHAYAGLDTAMKEQPWRENTQKRVILIGDAPAHESYTDDPRNFANETAYAKDHGIKIFAIGVYCDTGCQVLCSALSGLTGAP